MAMNKYLVECRTYLNTRAFLVRVKVTVVEFDSIKGGLDKRYSCPHRMLVSLEKCLSSSVFPSRVPGVKTMDHSFFPSSLL